MSKATIWNPNTAEKKVINVGEAIPTGFSLWTGGTASGQQAQQAIKTVANPAPIPTNPTSNTISTGINNSNVASSLPTSNDSAMKLYADNSLTDSTKLQSELQTNLDKFNAQRIADNKSQQEAEQANLKTIQSQKDNQIAGYDTQMNPLKDKAVGIYDSMLNSIKDTNYSDLTKTKLELTNDIVSYSKMMKEELDASASNPGLASVSTGRANAIKENYTSKIAVAQAASSAIDGNFNLAFDIMDKGANAIQNLTTDRINFINTVQSLFSSKETDSRNKILSLTTAQKDLLDKAKEDGQKKIDNLQKNKDTITELFKTNPIIAYKAGLSLTDTPEQSTKKLNDLYVKYPQYTPDNQAFIKKAMEKYYDAGITLNDPIETVKSKIQMSKIFEKENSGKFTLTTDINGNSVVFDSASGNVSDGQMRTDRNNNPTAMTTDVAKSLGLVEGVDYVVGDKFPGDSNLYTAKLLGNPIDTTIKALNTAANDPNKQAFFTQSGQQRWNYIGLSDKQWLAMTPEQKKNTIAQMYKQEGGSGVLVNGNNPNISSVTKKPLSETERVSQTYANRLEDSNNIINDLEKNFTGQWEKLNWLIPEFAKSEDRKKIEQAERNFVNAVLRKESGAAISDSEFESAKSQYFPQAGDTESVLAQKRLNRQTAVDGMRLSGGMYPSNNTSSISDDNAYQEYLKITSKK